MGSHEFGVKALGEVGEGSIFSFGVGIGPGGIGNAVSDAKNSEMLKPGRPRPTHQARQTTKYPLKRSSWEDGFSCAAREDKNKDDVTRCML